MTAGQTFYTVNGIKLVVFSLRSSLRTLRLK